MYGQHYAALGRDVDGALSVNLSPTETPKDVYSDVVDLVEKTRQTDAESGSQIAKVLQGKVLGYGKVLSSTVKR